MKRGSNFIFAGLIFVSGLMAQDPEFVQEEVVYKTVDGVSLKADLFYLADDGDDQYGRYYDEEILESDARE